MRFPRIILRLSSGHHVHEVPREPVRNLRASALWRKSVCLLVEPPRLLGACFAFDESADSVRLKECGYRVTRPPDFSACAINIAAFRLAKSLAQDVRNGPFLGRFNRNCHRLKRDLVVELPDNFVRRGDLSQPPANLFAKSRVERAKSS